MTAVAPPTAPPRAAGAPSAPAERPAPHGGRVRWRDRPWWPWAKRGLTAAFFVAVVWMLVSHASDIPWDEVGGAVRRLPAGALWSAAGVVAASHLLYSTFDLFGRRITGHTIPAPKVMAITFTSYAFNLNLGSLVGGIAFRYRLYAKHGLDNGQITRIMATSMFTNWAGYLLLAGAVFLLRPLELPPDWRIGRGALQPIGAALLAVPLGYLLACAFSKKRDWSLRGHQVTLPGARFAALQLLVSAANWLLIATTVWLLLQQRIPFTDVLSVLLLAAIAALAAHVPAGLGVLEAVFVSVLSHDLPKSELLGGLLAYRAIYYLAPLAVAAVMYLVMEARSPRADAPAR